MKILKWEYKVFSSPKDIKFGEFESKCNQKGSEGWEFCAPIILEGKVFYLFKKPCGYLD